MQGQGGSGAAAEVLPSPEGQRCHQPPLRQPLSLTERVISEQQQEQQAPQPSGEQAAGRRRQAAALSASALRCRAVPTAVPPPPPPGSARPCPAPAPAMPDPGLLSSSSHSACPAYPSLARISPSLPAASPPRFHAAPRGRVSRSPSSRVQQPERSRSVPDGPSAASTGPDT